MKKKVLLWVLTITFIFCTFPMFAQVTTTQSKSRFPQDFHLTSNITGRSIFLGDSTAGDTSQLRREVKQTRNFYIAKYEVTVFEWNRVIGRDRTNLQAGMQFFNDGNMPMTGVTWYDAIEYCNRRSRMDGLTPAYTVSRRGSDITVTWNKSANGWRLPTDHEWEIACRAGTTTRYHFGNSLSTSQANINNSRNGPRAVGSYSANAWGLYDMHGNVWEWVWDWYDSFTTGDEWATPRRLGTLVDYSGPSRRPELDDRYLTDIGILYGDYRVIRGGSWAEREIFCTSATRMALQADHYSNDAPMLYARFYWGKDGIIGFRIARNA